MSLFIFPQVSMSVPGLPVLENDESYSCFFQDNHSPATVTKTGVTCQSPETSRVPMVPPGQGECVLPSDLFSLCLISGLNFSTLWLEDLAAFCNEINLVFVCVFQHVQTHPMQHTVSTDHAAQTPRARNCSYCTTLWVHLVWTTCSWCPCSLVVPTNQRIHGCSYRVSCTPSDDTVYITRTLVDPHTLVEVESRTLDLHIYSSIPLSRNLGQHNPFFLSQFTHQGVICILKHTSSSYTAYPLWVFGGLRPIPAVIFKVVRYILGRLKELPINLFNLVILCFDKCFGFLVWLIVKHAERSLFVVVSQGQW